MKNFPLLTSAAVLATLAGCDAQIRIDGHGDVISDSGARNCYAESESCIERVSGEYVESYLAVPRPGHRFVGWNYCQFQEGNVCRFAVDAGTVKQAWGKDVPAIVAKFELIPPVEAHYPTYTTVGCSATYPRQCGGETIRQGMRLRVEPGKNLLTCFGGCLGGPYTGDYLPTANGWTFQGGWLSKDNVIWHVSVTSTGDNIVYTWSPSSDEYHHITLTGVKQ